MKARCDQHREMIGVVAGLPEQVPDLAVLGVERLADVLVFDHEWNEAGGGITGIDGYVACVVERASRNLVAGKGANFSSATLGIEPYGAAGEVLERSGDVALGDLAAEAGIAGPAEEGAVEPPLGRASAFDGCPATICDGGAIEKRRHRPSAQLDVDALKSSCVEQQLARVAEMVWIDMPSWSQIGSVFG